MGNHQSDSKKQRRPSIHSGTIYSSNKRNPTKSAKSVSKSKSNSHFVQISNFNQSASELKETLPADLKQYCNSIEIMYRFWCSEIEVLSPHKLKETAVLFYMNAFTLLPGSRKLFTKNIELQAKQFFGMFRWLIMSLKQPDPQRLIKRIRALGTVHNNLGIKEEWYCAMLQAFHATMTETASHRYTSRTRFCMEQLYTLVMNIMLNKDFKSLSSDNIANLLGSLNKLEDCLDDKEARSFLQMFMTQQFCVELMLFYQDYRRFKACVNKIQRAQIGNEILTKYLKGFAPCEINVSYTSRNDMFQTLKKNHNVFTDEIFDVCCQECLELIRANVWNAFKREILQMAVDADIKYEKHTLH